jgi:hypothetical protein
VAVYGKTTKAGGAQGLLTVLASFRIAPITPMVQAVHFIT